MSHTQDQQPKVPDGFPELLKELSQAVLKHQPKDVYQFCANFFQNRSSSKPQQQPVPSRSTVAASSSSTTASPPVAAAMPSELEKNKPEADEASLASDLESDEDETAPLPPVQPAANRGRRTSVSAESMKPSDEVYTKIDIPKSDEQRQRIGQSVKNNFLFRNLDDEQYKDIVDAMAEKRLQAGEDIIKQGGVGDFFYIVETGQFDVFVSKNGAPAVKVAQVGPGGSFGELALMYNAPRAATITATSEAILWALDRVTFRRILMDSTSKKRRMYEELLENVPVLKSLEAYERHKIADALESVVYNDGDVVIRQGDVGDNFYFIESGEAVVTQADEKGEVNTISTLKQGDYFGELSLITSKPRAATITAKGKLKVATMGKKAFDRLLGPAVDIMKRNLSVYKTLTRRKSIQELVERIEAEMKEAESAK